MLRDDFLARIKPACGFCLPASGAIPIYQKLCFKDNKVFAQNGENGYVTECDLGIDFMVPAAKLLSLVSTFPNEDISFSIKQNALHIVCGSTKCRLLTEDVSSYPDPLPKVYGHLELPTNLLESVEVCSRLIDLNATNKFMGVAIHGNHVYSTDGVRATRYELDAHVSDDCFFIPIKSAKSLLKLDPPSALISWDNFIGTMYPDPWATWYSGLLAGSFPSELIDGFFKKTPEYSTTYDFPDEIEVILDRLMVILDDHKDGIVVSSSDGYLKLEAESMSTGKITEILHWGFGEDFSFRVDPSYFRSAVGISKSANFSEILGEFRHPLIRFYGQNAQHIIGLMV